MHIGQGRKVAERTAMGYKPMSAQGLQQLCIVINMYVPCSEETPLGRGTPATAARLAAGQGARGNEGAVRFAGVGVDRTTEGAYGT
jgi:hypothetical protein